MARTRAKDTRTEADWRGFHKLLAIGAARMMGVLPMPPEVLERLRKEKEACESERSREVG